MIARRYLWRAAQTVLALPFHSGAWSVFFKGLRGAAFVLLRLLMLLAFPVSVLGVAWLLSRADRRVGP